jgi:hypothetical protein
MLKHTVRLQMSARSTVLQCNTDVYYSLAVSRDLYSILLMSRRRISKAAAKIHLRTAIVVRVPIYIPSCIL